MKVLVIGSGGREHALAWGLHRSGATVGILPGNAGTLREGVNFSGSWKDRTSVQQVIESFRPDLVVLGPEAPIAEGLGDWIRQTFRIPVFAPPQKTAFLEASKIQAKEFMARNGIPTASFETHTDLHSALKSVEQWPTWPVVIKADGLAGGKGVVIAPDKTTATQTLIDFMEKGKFGPASQRVVLETYLEGYEASVFVLIDSEYRYQVLGDAMDYKRLLDGDRGPNTGGMGAISPHPKLSHAERQQILDRVIRPTIEGLKKEWFPYSGVLYFGLMITDHGPYVLEYNIRFGDPEAQVLIPRLKGDFARLLYRYATASNGESEVQTDEHLHAVTVILASQGYPVQYETGKVIEGLEDLRDQPNVLIFHAGTSLQGQKVVTAGGRVLNVVGLGTTLSEARTHAYQAVQKIRFEGMTYRTDIAAF